MDTCGFARVLVEYSVLSEAWGVGFFLGSAAILSAVPVRMLVRFISRV